MSAIPFLAPNVRRQHIILKEDPPGPMSPPRGCRFHPRCLVAADHCAVQEPRLLAIGPGHLVAGWRLI